MTIVPDGQSPLPPLKIKKPPLITSTDILAVGTVRLRAADVTPRHFKDFYVGLLGLTPDTSGDADFAFRLQKIRVEFTRNPPAELHPLENSPHAGKLMLLILQFDTALRALEDLRIPYEYLHYDLGLCRAASLFDPADNNILLIESRSL